jgi:hypothetical protein
MSALRDRPASTVLAPLALIALVLVALVLTRIKPLGRPVTADVTCAPAVSTLPPTALPSPDSIDLSKPGAPGVHIVSPAPVASPEASPPPSPPATPSPNCQPSPQISPSPSTAPSASPSPSSKPEPLPTPTPAPTTVPNPGGGPGTPPPGPPAEVPVTLGLTLPLAALDGDAVRLHASLHAGTRPLSDSALQLSVNGAYRLDLVTGPDGSVVYNFAHLRVGSNLVSLTYRGDHSRGLSAASAQANIRIRPLTSSALKVNAPPPTRAGQRASISLSLDSPIGPVDNAPLVVTLNGKQMHEVVTDRNGQAHLDVSRSTPAGTYDIEAAFAGDRGRGLEGSSAAAVIKLLPLQLTLQTLPALPGVAFQLDGATLVTDSNGKVDVPVAQAGQHELSVTPTDMGPEVQATFERWSDGELARSRSLRLLGDLTLYAAFGGDYLTHFRFLDADGNPVDANKVKDVVLSGPEGTTVPLTPPYQPFWLHVPAPSRAVLEGVTPPDRYSVVSARYGGVDVVKRGDATYMPGKSSEWNIKLRVYTLRVFTRQPVIGAGPPTIVSVSREQGSVESALSTSSGEAQLTGLPSGSYVVRTKNNRLAATVVVTLSHSQDVVVPVMSWLEAVASILAFMAIGTALVAARRRWRKRRLIS